MKKFHININDYGKSDRRDTGICSEEECGV